MEYANAANADECMLMLHLIFCSVHVCSHITPVAAHTYAQYFNFVLFVYKQLLYSYRTLEYQP